MTRTDPRGPGRTKRRRTRRRHDRRRLRRTLEQLLPQCVPGLTPNRATEPARHLATRLIDSGWLRQHDQETIARRHLPDNR